MEDCFDSLALSQDAGHIDEEKSLFYSIRSGPSKTKSPIHNENMTPCAQQSTRTTFEEIILNSSETTHLKYIFAVKITSVAVVASKNSSWPVSAGLLEKEQNGRRYFGFQSFP